MVGAHTNPTRGVMEAIPHGCGFLTSASYSHPAKNKLDFIGQLGRVMIGMSSNTANMNIPANMVGIVENLMELSKLGVDWDGCGRSDWVGWLGAGGAYSGVGAADEEIQEMKSKNAYNLFCKIFVKRRENPDPANRKETYLFGSSLDGVEE